LREKDSKTLDLVAVYLHNAIMETAGETWTPQAGPQAAFVDSRVFDVVYGGARGGGKTDAALGDFARHAETYGAEARGLLVRRTRSALEPTIERAKAIYAPYAAKWQAQKSRFLWPSGAVLYFRHLDRDADAELYQGHSYTRVYVEELTQFASPRPVDKLKATLRSAAGAPCGFRATCNPGGAGHNWVKARYIDPGPWTEIERDGLTQLFIPAKLADNPKLAQADPLYVERLRQSGSETLVKAWLDGDWNIVEGAFFDRWSERNIVRPFAIPDFWTRIRSFDWGYAAPFSVGWWAVASDPTPVGDLVIPRGAMIRYREWYGARDGAGLKLTAEEVAAGILEREAGEKIIIAVADPSIFAHNGGPSIAERMARAGCAQRPANNTRVGRIGALSGWDQVRARIAGREGAPLLYVFETCRDFIRTVPVLQHDPQRAEDVDTGAEDHVADETRYACLSRPIEARPTDPPGAPPDRWRRPEAAADWKTF
jgi:hypothetical protein